MLNRLFMTYQNGVLEFQETAERKTKTDRSVKKAPHLIFFRKISIWFGKAISIKPFCAQEIFLNKGSLIDYLNFKGACLKKGFFGLKRSSNQDVLAAFEKIILGKSFSSSMTPSNLKELEDINAKDKLVGRNGASIFVEITSDGFKKTIDALKSVRCSHPPLKKCHIGVACFVNFSIAAALQAEKIVILDYDPVVVKFNRLARNLLITSASSQDFKVKLIELCKNDQDLSTRKFYPKTLTNTLTIEHLNEILEGPDSFLSSENDFQLMKELAKKGNIHVLQASIYDCDFINKIKKLCGQEGYIIDSLFISNVYGWDHGKDKKKLLQTR